MTIPVLSVLLSVLAGCAPTLTESGRTGSTHSGSTFLESTSSSDSESMLRETRQVGFRDVTEGSTIEVIEYSPEFLPETSILFSYVSYEGALREKRREAEKRLWTEERLERGISSLPTGGTISFVGMSAFREAVELLDKLECVLHTLDAKEIARSTGTSSDVQLIAGVWVNAIRFDVDAAVDSPFVVYMIDAGLNRSAWIVYPAQVYEGPPLTKQGSETP